MTFENKLVLYFPSPLISLFLSYSLCPFLWNNYCCSAVFVVCFNKLRKAFMEPLSNTFEICLRNLLHFYGNVMIFTHLFGTSLMGSALNSSFS